MRRGSEKTSSTARRTRGAESVFSALTSDTQVASSPTSPSASTAAARTAGSLSVSIVLTRAGVKRSRQPIMLPSASAAAMRAAGSADLRAWVRWVTACGASVGPSTPLIALAAALATLRSESSSAFNKA